MCTRGYAWWLAHLSKGGEVGEVKEVIVTEKQCPDAGHVVTGVGGATFGHL